MDQQFALVLNAISLATRAHQGQRRKDDVTPYAAHPLRVMTVMALHFGVEDLDALAAAALHDVLEDTTLDRDDLEEAFGARVASFVAALSKDGRLPEQERERRFMEQLLAAPLEVKLCKLADIFDNLSDLAGLPAHSRRKKISHAHDTVRLFESALGDRWRHALQAVREQIAEAESFERPAQEE